MTIRHCGIFSSKQKPEAEAVATELKDLLDEHSISHSSFSLMEENRIDEDIDFAVSIGGDGTVLGTARSISHMGIPIFPINIGSFGFITEVGREDWHDDLNRALVQGPRFYNRLMLEISVERNGQTSFRSPALNDMVIGGAGISKLVRLEVALSFAALGEYRADGIIVASPTGSTAYSAAAGGPILHPEMEAMILTPICAFSLSTRPIVLPEWENVRIIVSRGQRTDLMLTVDGQIVYPLQELDEIIVRAAAYKARIAYSRKRDFYDVLRTKLNWSGGSDA